jgi:DHA2 family methylenomycin A resistance protein-like MFS transporter
MMIAVGASIAGVGCIALLGVAPGQSYWAIGAQLLAIGAGLGLLVPPLTATLLGSVEKARSGIAAGVLNATRQTGSVIGVALFGSLIGGASGFIPGAREALIVSAALLIGAAATVLLGSASARG